MEDKNGKALPPGVISIEAAKQLNNTWSETRCGAMNQCITDVTDGKITEDNRSSWWSLKDLKTYLKYAKKQAKKQNKKVTGFRVYCGAYNNENQDENYYSTSFIVPTTGEGSLGKDYGDGDENDLPINPLNVGQAGDPPGGGYIGG